MRPRGEVRLAMASAVDTLAGARGAFTSRDAAYAAQVEFELARLTLQDMRRAGELQAVGQMAVPGIKRPLTLYAPTKPRGTELDGAAALQGVVRRWADFQ